MPRINVKKLSVEELVQRFIELTTRQDKKIAESGAYPQAADARLALDRLDGHPIVP